jgi:hypothetical protein
MEEKTVQTMKQIVKAIKSPWGSMMLLVKPKSRQARFV